MGENRQLAMSALALMGVMAGAAQSWSQTSSHHARGEGERVLALESRELENSSHDQ